VISVCFQNWRNSWKDGRKFVDNENVIQSASGWLDDQDQEFLYSGMRLGLAKCISVGGDCWKVTKYVHILLLTVSSCERFWTPYVWDHFALPRTINVVRLNDVWKAGGCRPSLIAEGIAYRLNYWPATTQAPSILRVWPEWYRVSSTLMWSRHNAV